MEKLICDLIDKQKTKLIENYTSNGISQKSWKKFYGDVCCRIFSSYIAKCLQNKYKVSEPNAYIIGFPTEFDLLIVKKDSFPVEYSNAYNPKDVVAGIEFKAHGIYGGRKDLKNVIDKIRQKFEEVNKRYPHIKFSYLTYTETTNPKRKGSINYFHETKKYLGNKYKAFCLKDSRTNKILKGQWDSFINNLV